MQWIVTGANRTTGEDTQVRVRASTEAEAVKEAGRQGVLVTSVVALEDIAEEVEHKSHGTSARGGRALPGSDKYAAITQGAGLIEGFGSLANLLGVASIVVGGVVGILIMQNPSGVTAGGMFMVTGLLYGIAMFFVGAFLKMQAGLALAVRDIALNTAKD